MTRFKTMSKKTQFSDMVDFRTPKYLFDYINSIEKIDFDGACEDGKNNLATPLRLEEEWPNGVVYSNPPFDIDSINKWINKGWVHSRKVEGNVSIILIPNKLTQVKFQLNSENKFDSIIFLGGRVDFVSPYATKGGTSRMGSVILIQKIGASGVHFKQLKQIKRVFK